MKKQNLLLLGYCVPLAYLALYADAASGAVWGYGLLMVGAVVLGWLCAKVEGAPFWWGNALSAAVSLLCTWLVFGGRMDHYFKPFSAIGWAVGLSAVSLGIQWLVMKRQWLILGLVSGGVGAMLLAMYSLQWSM